MDKEPYSKHDHSMATYYQVSDRQGTKVFSSKPKFEAGFDIFSGTRATRTPKKGDRVIKKFTCTVTSSNSSILKHYPKKISVK